MRACVAIATAFALASCTLGNIHDPKFGLLSNTQSADLLKSIRCELITFYAANAARKKALDSIRDSYRRLGQAKTPLKVVLDHKYFDLDTDAYGAFVLEAKVVDTIGAPGASTSLANVLHSTAKGTQTLTVGPNLSSQGTYDMNFNFAIQQDDSLSDVVGEINEENVPASSADFGNADNPYQCYRAVVKDHYAELAAGKYPTLERFSRITVDGDKPLAAWLQENTTVMGPSRNILSDVNPPKRKNGKPRTPAPVELKYLNEAADGGQMSYVFTVQYTGGIDAKFSLISSRWNPLAPDFSASAVQTGVLSLYVNGYMTQAALGAKAGVVGIAGRAGPPAPTQVFVVNGYKNPSGVPPIYPPVIMTPQSPTGGGPAVAPQGLPPPSRGPNRGQMLAPVTPFILSPGP